ncbi:MAG: hypothetical protein A2096_07605 [Spirochaetes bacterium GWF1_41_5]|nr:MAG: hypothetical protein A2096_07605 [Spirochaetes bacterium GWF1_41_5]
MIKIIMLIIITTQVFAGKKAASLLNSETVYYADNAVLSTTVFLYSSNNILTGKEEKDDAGFLQKKWTYEYHDKTITEKEYNQKNELKAQKKTIYSHMASSAKGVNPLTEIFLDAEGKQRSSLTYIYDKKGVLLSMNACNEANVTLYTVAYQYKKKLLVKIEFKSSTGELDRYSASEYDKKGVKTRETYFTAANQIEKYILYEYSKGAVKEITYAADGMKKHTRLVEFNEAGHIIKISFFNDKDRLEEYKTLIYK